MTRVQVKQETYYSKKEFEKKTARMLGRGWTITDQEIKEESPGLLLLPLLGPFALAKTKVYHVTYRK